MSERQVNVSSTVEKTAEWGGYLGMILIHGATMPTTIGNIMGWTDALPPLSMVLLVWLGLILFFIRALVRFDWLYLISNGVGFILNSILLIIIVFGS